jgi:selenocysteine lyase/cysteine desulfurase
VSFKPHYSRFLKGLGDRLHFCAHSHHPWPDCTRDAVLACWDDASGHADEKWDKVFGEVLPSAQKSVAEALNWPAPGLVAFAPNTHEFVGRLLSCAPAGRPPRLLTTDSEFHSFARQSARLEEDGAKVERVAVEPFATFVDRFVAAADGGHYDLVFLSQVFFNSGLKLDEADLIRIAQSAKSAVFAVDGYHAFMAAPLDLARLAPRMFYLAGGYKYAQAGEGVCFLAVPPRCGLRPSNTGWFADFAGLEKPIKSPVGYGQDGARFWGSTFDPTGLYRWNAVTAWKKSLGMTVAKSDAHVRALQRGFLSRLAAKPRGPFKTESLVSTDLVRLGHFFTFRVPEAPALAKRLASEIGVLADARGDRLRFGFGLYHDEADLDALFSRLDRFA